MKNPTGNLQPHDESGAWLQRPKILRIVGRMIGHPLYAVLFSALFLIQSCSSDTVTAPKSDLGKGSIYGTITDSASGIAIPHVSLTIVPLLQTVITDTNGQFELDSLAVGTYYITLAKSLYTSKVDSVTVNAGVLTKFNRYLAKPTTPIDSAASDTVGTITGWQMQAKPVIEDLRGVDYADAHTIVAVGTAGTIVRSADAGLSWTVMQSGVQADLYAVEFMSPMQGIAIGDSGYVLRTTDAGQSWKASSISPTISFRGLSFLDPAHGILVGANLGSGVAYVTADGGMTWINRSGGLGGHAPVTAWWRTTDTILIAGETGHYARSFDQGASWEQNVFGSSEFLSLVGLNNHSAVNQEIGVLAGAGGTLYTTTNGGALLNAVTSLTQNDLNGAAFADAKHCFAVGYHGIILSSTNGTTNWSSIFGPVSSSLYAVRFYNRTHGIIVGEFGVILLPKVQ